MNSIAIENLSVILNNTKVLSNITLSLESGKFLGIVGPNGCGKTTLLRTLIGSIRPTTGNVSVCGMTPYEAVRKNLLGYLPQTQNIISNFPARAVDVVLMGLYHELGMLRWPSIKHRHRAYEALATLGMSGLEEASFSRLSGGQQQRVSIARALINKPCLLLLDEPNTGIDMLGQNDFYQLLKELQRSMGLSIIMVSHDIGAITSYVDEIACLNKTLHYHGHPVGALEESVLKKLYGRDVDIMTHSECCHTCQRLKHD
ncbi:MAG: metal ABC transporter ATP-binding protein [Nitrospiraceae bacterium]|nr:metal ABC transporter ATP-binding protein [Nitrospiraceae bacterium]